MKSNNISMFPVHRAGAAISGDGMTASKVDTAELVIGSAAAVTSVAVDEVEGIPSELVGGSAFKKQMQKVHESIRDIDPDNNFFRDNTVITLPLLPQSFAEGVLGWTLVNWKIVDGQAFFTGTNNLHEPNYLQMDSSVFNSPGYYFLHINVPRLDSGALKLYDAGGNELFAITEYGTKSFEIFVADPTIASYKLIADGVYPDEVLCVGSVSLHRVTPRLKEYLTYIFSGEGNIGVSREELTAAIRESNRLTAEFIANQITPIRETLEVHLQSSNPHNVTWEMIGAAAANHTHQIEDFGGAPLHHTHTPEECGSAPIEHSHTPEQCGAAPVNHGHTATEVGASPYDHTHSPESIGAAKDVHTHSLEDLGAAAKLHVHDEYTTDQEADVIARAAAYEILAAAIERTAPMVAPITLASAPAGSLPDKMEDSSLSHPVTPIILPYIVHRSSGHYDYFEGAAATNVATLDGHPIQYAFKKHLTPADMTANVAAFYSATEELQDYVLIEYFFHTVRKIDAYTFFKDSTGAIGGVPTEWMLMVDGVPVRETAGEHLAWYTETSVTDVLNQPVTGRRFSFVVKRVHRDSNGHWGVRVEFSFADVAAGKMAISSPITFIGAHSDGVKLVYIDRVPEIDPGLTEKNTPLYVYVDYTNEAEPAFKLSPLRPEYSNVKKGVPGLIGKFEGKINQYWGQLSVTSENPAHLVENIYGDDEGYFRSAGGVTDATIVHLFNEPIDICGHRLVFSKDTLDEKIVPDKWTLKMFKSDNTEILVESVESYCPARGNGDGEQTWWIQDYDLIYKDIVRVELKLYGTRNQIALGLWKFILMFDSVHFNIRMCLLSPETMFPLGRLEYTTNHDKSWAGMIHSGLVLGDSCHLPIDHFNPQPSGIRVHTIPNPFGTKDIDYTVFALEIPGQQQPLGNVEQITDEYIRFISMGPGRYSLRISRNW